MCRISLVTGLVLLAGTSVSNAQPVLDGHLDPTLYGPAKWLQTLPTTYGDNRPDLCTSVGNRVSFAINNSNALGVSGGTAAGDPVAAAAVTTGVEVRIPLSQLGNPAGAIRVAGFINNGDCNYLSNQVIGGFTAPRGNLGGDMNGNFNGSAAMINFSDEINAPGPQFITVPNAAGSGTAPVLDGTLDAYYGAPIWVQNTQTGFGDSSLATVDYANGSEIDAVYGKIATADYGDGPQAYLFLFVAGNVETNFNRLNLFFDTGGAGGQNQLIANPGADGLANMTGMTFDTGFAANYYMDFRCGGSPFGIYADFAKLNPVGGGGYIGGGAAATAVIGAGNNCPPDAVISTGSELDGLYSYVDRTNNRLYMMFTGNLKAGDFVALFFDANGNPTGDEGQNVLHGAGNIFGVERPNPSIGIADGGAGSLNRCGFDGTSPGLTFDAGFYADYYLNTHIENTNREAADSAVIRTHGRAETLSGVPLDYGSYTGANIPTVVAWDGTSFDQAIPATGVGGFPASIQPQDGSTPNLLSHFPPRESSRVLAAYQAANGGNLPPANNMDGTNPVWTDWLGATNSGLNPVAPVASQPRSGLLRMRIDNSNIVGVTAASGAGAGTAAYGFEVSVNLEELGYNPRSRVRVAGFIVNGAFTSVSNQVLGDPLSVNDLGDPRMINFAADPNPAHKHYVVVASCVADFNGDGVVAVQDIFDFLTAWFGGDPRADINGGGLGVQDIFDFLSLWFAGPCIGG